MAGNQTILEPKPPMFSGALNGVPKRTPNWILKMHTVHSSTQRVAVKHFFYIIQAAFVYVSLCILWFFFRCCPLHSGVKVNKIHVRLPCACKKDSTVFVQDTIVDSGFFPCRSVGVMLYFYFDDYHKTWHRWRSVLWDANDAACIFFRPSRVVIFLTTFE